MIFILGANGFVGSAFVRYCERNNVAFTPITRDNYAACIGKTCDILINASGNSFKRTVLTNPLLDFDKNVRGTLCSLLDFQFSRFIYLSSIDVYNDLSCLQNNSEENPILPGKLSRYGLNKYLGEMLVRRYAQNYLIVRLGGMVGPGLKKNAIYDLTHGNRLFVHPNSAYQYMHTDHVARIAMHLSDLLAAEEVINLCGDGVVRPIDVQGWIQRTISYQNDLPHEHYEININKLKSILPVPTSESSVRQYLSETFGQILL